MIKVWRIKEKLTDDVFEQLLINRGLISEEDRENFFNSRIENYRKDLEVPGIEKTVSRLQKAISNDELIIIFGDYDVDGVSASAILYKALTSIGAKVLPYIPHREKEGYGLSKLGLEFARDSGAGIVITVDNGIVALEESEYAKSLGLELIITDHHTPGDKKPEAFSIVHSTKMCGAAVAWCLVRKIIKEELAHELLELVALATVADMMPLLDLNRVFVKEGLKVLNRTKNPGLLALFEESRIEKGSIGSFEIGHILAPRINAIGRLEHAIDALRLLCTKDQVKAKRLAKLLQDTNLRRQELTTKAYEEAKILAEQNLNKKIQVLYSESWHPGIIGLIAARITEQYFMPSIAISVSDKVSKGSARSIDGINITQVLRRCSELLVDVGGHAGAAGFSVKTQTIRLFKKKIEEEMEKSEKSAEKFLDIEAELPVSKINKTLIKKIEELAPFGLENPQPLFAALNVKLTDIRTVGGGKHLKFKSEGIDAIAFNMGDLESFIAASQTADIAFCLEMNKFNGSENLQLKVKDIQLT